MLSSKEIEKLIYRDVAHTVEQEGWIDVFYELWLERYHALNIVKSPTSVIKPGREVLLELMRSFSFDEMHLFKIFEDANVYALLTDKGDNYWSYTFVVLYRNAPDKVAQNCNTVEELKKYFDYKEPVLEIPLPHDRKYSED